MGLLSIIRSRNLREKLLIRDTARRTGLPRHTLTKHLHRHQARRLIRYERCTLRTRQLLAKHEELILHSRQP